MNRFIIIISLIIVFPNWAIPQEAREISLSEAIEIALKNNLHLKESHGMIAGREAGVGKARSEWYPKLNLSISSGYDKSLSQPGEPQTIELFGEVQEITPTLGSRWSNLLSFRLTQNLYTGGELTGSLREAEAGLEIARCDYKAVRQGLILEVKRVYWELVRQDLLVRLSEEMLAHCEETLQLANSRLSCGSIAPVEVEEAKVALANEREGLIQAQTRRRETADELKNLLNIGFEPEIKPLDRPDPEPSLELTIDEAIKTALKGRPELTRLHKEIWRGESNLMRAKSQRYPHLRLKANYDWAGSDKDYYRDAWQDVKPSGWGVGVYIDCPIFDGHLAKSSIKEAKSGLVVAGLGLEKKEKEIIKEVRSFYYRLISARERIETMKENVGLAEENLRIAKLQFKVGTITSNELANYEVSLSKVKTRFIDSLIDYEIAKAGLTWAMGENR